MNNFVKIGLSLKSYNSIKIKPTTTLTLDIETGCGGEGTAGSFKWQIQS